MAQSTMLQYEAPWPVHALDWCKTPTPGQHHLARASYRLGVGSFTEDFRNRIAIVGVQDERVLIDDGSSAASSSSLYDDQPSSRQQQQQQQQPQQQDLVTLCEANHGYPATCLQWQPASATAYAWSQKSAATEFLATTSDALRIWEYAYDGALGGAQMSSFVGRPQAATAGNGESNGHRLTMKTALSGQSKVQNQTTGAPLTSFSWNEKAPSLIVTSSIDTTCTVWNIDTTTALTQLIAHDREVYDVAWLPRSTDIFVSVGADGSLRAFDLRSLDHSTILYETPAPKTQQSTSAAGGSSSSSASAAAAAAAAGGGAGAGSAPSSVRPATSPLLRIAFHPHDHNYMSTFHMDGSEIQILDMRSPGVPVFELRQHRAPINALGWSSKESPLLATAGDDCQLLIWDLSTHQNATSPRNAAGGGGSARLSSPRPDAKKRVVTDPVFAYTAQGEINNLAWSPQINGAVLGGGYSLPPSEWVAIASGRSIRMLRL